MTTRRPRAAEREGRAVGVKQPISPDVHRQEEAVIFFDGDAERYCCVFVFRVLQNTKGTLKNTRESRESRPPQATPSTAAVPYQIRTGVMLWYPTNKRQQNTGGARMSVLINPPPPAGSAGSPPPLGATSNASKRGGAGEQSPPALVVASIVASS